jgi:hypothetical protein
MSCRGAGAAGLAAAALWASSGCLESPGVDCDDGRICPAGTLCDDEHGQCILPEQLEGCGPDSDGTDCSFGELAGICDSGVCLRAGCGDGYLRAPEQCDTTAPAALDDCTENGFHEPGPVTCSAGCLLDTSACSGRCGDGARDGPEACDDTDLGGYDCLDFGFQAAPGLACSGACDPGACLDAAAGAADPEVASFAAVAGQIYFVVVDSSSEDVAGDFALQLACP